jgi:hypothetical protein
LTGGQAAVCIRHRFSHAWKLIHLARQAFQQLSQISNLSAELLNDLASLLLALLQVNLNVVLAVVKFGDMLPDGEHFMPNLGQALLVLLAELAVLGSGLYEGLHLSPKAVGLHPSGADVELIGHPGEGLGAGEELGLLRVLVSGQRGWCADCCDFAK